MLGGPESKRLKVAALNLFHPTASPPFAKSHIFCIATQWGEGRDEGERGRTWKRDELVSLRAEGIVLD